MVVEGEFVHLVQKSFPLLYNSVLVYICTFLVRLWTEAQLVKPVSLVVRKNICCTFLYVISLTHMSGWRSGQCGHCLSASLHVIKLRLCKLQCIYSD